MQYRVGGGGDKGSKIIVHCILCVPHTGVG